MLNNTFSLHRTGLLIWSDLHNNLKRILLVIGGLLVLGTILFLLQVEGRGMYPDSSGRLPDELVTSVKFHLYFFPFSLMLGGFVLTSLSFWEFSKKASRQFYLSLPASNLEKLVSKWLLTAVFFSLVWLGAYQLFEAFAQFYMSAQGFTMVPLAVTDLWVWRWIGLYIGLQSTFLLAAAAFSRFTLFKSLLVLLSVVIVLWLTVKLILNGLYASNDRIYPQIDLILEISWKVLAFVVFPTVLYICFLKLKEKEL